MVEQFIVDGYTIYCEGCTVYSWRVGNLKSLWNWEREMELVAFLDKFQNKFLKIADPI